MGRRDGGSCTTRYRGLLQRRRRAAEVCNTARPKQMEFMASSAFFAGEAFLLAIRHIGGPGLVNSSRRFQLFVFLAS